MFDFQEKALLLTRLFPLQLVTLWAAQVLRTLVCDKAYHLGDAFPSDRQVSWAQFGLGGMYLTR